MDWMVGRPARCEEAEPIALDQKRPKTKDQRPRPETKTKDQKGRTNQNTDVLSFVRSFVSGSSQ